MRLLLEREPGFQIVGETGDGLEAVQQVRRLKPDVLVLDLLMPSLNGFAVLRRVRLSSPKTRVVVFSIYGDEARVGQAFRLGATAYVLKEAPAGELVAAVRAAAEGKFYVSSPFSAIPIEDFLRKARGIAPQPYEKLTDREREVLQLVAEGRTNKEIARRLRISRRTVEVHRANMMHKLNLRNTAAVVRFALAQGLLSSK